MNQSIIIRGAKRGILDLYTNNIFNTKYATGGGTSRNHNTSLGFVEDALHTAGVVDLERLGSDHVSLTR